MPQDLIRKFPDPLLRHVSKPVTQFDSKLEVFAKQLVTVMKNQPGGIGIAAPQIGVLKRVAIVDVSPKVPNSSLLILINPEIIKSREVIVLREGCMSLPDFTANVRRFEEIEVKWQDLKGNWQYKIAVSLEARCIQHEIDHLNGLLFLDRVSTLKSDVFRRKRYL